jgi:hypothetical protein
VRSEWWGPTLIESSWLYISKKKKKKKRYSLSLAITFLLSLHTQKKERSGEDTVGQSERLHQLKCVRTFILDFTISTLWENMFLLLSQVFDILLWKPKKTKILILENKKHLRSTTQLSNIRFQKNYKLNPKLVVERK